MVEQAAVTAYGCTTMDCQVALDMHTWPVEVDGTGLPLDDADAQCPECYGPGRPVVSTS